MAKPKRPTIAVRKPPAAADTFVTHGTQAAKRHSANDTKTPQRTSSTYTRKDGVVLKRANLWLPTDVAKALAIYAVTNDRDQSDVATEGICRAVGLAWPRP